MGFHDVQFPPTIAYRSVGGPGYNTNIIELSSGGDQRIQRWSDPKHRYDVATGIKTYEDLSAIRAFFVARGGAVNSFRFKDWSDYHSSPTDPSFRGSAGTSDQIIGTGNSSITQFQLVKIYTSGPTSYTRTIQKPVSGTVRIWFDSAEQLSGWTCNYDTGIITFTTAPSSGVVISASFEFDVPARFDKTADEWFKVNITDFGGGAIDNLELVEDLDPAAPNLSEFFYGGASERVLTADHQLSFSDGRVQTFTAATTGFSLLCPFTLGVPPGGPLLYVVIGSGSSDITLKTHFGATMLTLSADEGVELLLSKDSGGSLVWIAQ